MEWAVAKCAEGVEGICPVGAHCQRAVQLRIERGGMCSRKAADSRDTPGCGAALRSGVAWRGRGVGRRKAKGSAARGCSAWRCGRTAWGCVGARHAVPSAWCAMWDQVGALCGAACVWGGGYGHASLI